MIKSLLSISFFLFMVNISFSQCKSGNCINGWGTYTFTGKWSGDKYVGEFKDGKRNGHGTYTYTNGDKYVGEFKDSELHGQGNYSYASGSKFVGEFKYGKKNGHGTFTWASGSKYVGEWKDGKYHGYGTYTYTNGSKYVGEWKDGKYHGYSTKTWADGEKYVGEFKDDKRNGYGTFTWVSGSKYVGEWKDGKYHGYGILTYSPGIKDAGIWEDDKIIKKMSLHSVETYLKNKYTPIDHSKSSGNNSCISGNCTNGHGTFTWASGSKYVGEWKDGKYHGYGTYTWYDGDLLEASWEQGIPNGNAKWIKENKDVYVGEIKGSKSPDGGWVFSLDGQGTYTYASGNKYVGEYKDGKKNGQGTYTYASGDKYVGEYKDSKKNGHGTYTFASGNKYVGEWKYSKYHGYGTFTYKDGRKNAGIWEENKLIEKRSVNEASTGHDQEMKQRRKLMVQYLETTGVNDMILDAMAIVPMEFFAPLSAREFLYKNNPIPIGYNESISQPSLTAMMIQKLDLNKGDKILELKTASGYQTAILAYMGMDVTTIESDRSLAEHLKTVFNKFNLPNIDLKAGNYLRSGWPENGPYDAIIATAAYADMPYKVREQLAPGGVFIVPVGNNKQELIIIKRDSWGRFTQNAWMDVRFSMMPEASTWDDTNNYLENLEKAKLEEERIRKETEEKIRKEVEEEIRKETEERIRKEIEEKVRKEAEERALRDASVKTNNDNTKNSNLKLKGKCPSIPFLKIQHTYTGKKWGSETEYNIYEDGKSEIDLGIDDMFDSDDNNKIRIKWEPTKPSGVTYRIILAEEGGESTTYITQNTERILEGLNRGSKYHIKVACDCGKKGGSQAFGISVITP